MSAANTTELLESLAADIGENIYMDIAKWHLYLGDAKLHTTLAEKLWPMVTSDDISEEGVIKALQEIPIKLGGGRKSLPLADLLPMQCQVSLIDLLEEFQHKL